MSFISKKSLLERIRRGKEARSRLVSSNLDKGIAFQIRATRSDRDWSQVKLAEETGMSPNNISRVESEDYGKQTITSLKRIAKALDVALVVRFVPFSQYIDWLSGTPFLDEGIGPAVMAVPSFDSEEDLGVYDSAPVGYFERHINPHFSAVNSTGIVTPSTTLTLLSSPEILGLYTPSQPYEAREVA